MNKAPHPIVRNRESLVTPSETPIFSDAEKTNCSQLWNQILPTLIKLLPKAA